MTTSRPEPRLFLADVDHTLVRENTTFAFVAHVVRRRGSPLGRLVHAGLLARRSPGRLLGAVLYRLTGLDPLRRLSFRLLRGMERETLQALAREYVDGVLEERTLAEPLTLLREAAAEGARVCLVSASLEVVVEPLAERLGADFRSSTLEWDGSRTTGRLAKDLAGAKVEAVENLLEEAGHVTVMSDNLSDLRLLRRAHRRLVVLRREGDQVRWTGVWAEFLGPYGSREEGP